LEYVTGCNISAFPILADIIEIRKVSCPLVNPMDSAGWMAETQCQTMWLILNIEKMGQK